MFQLAFWQSCQLTGHLRREFAHPWKLAHLGNLIAHCSLEAFRRAHPPWWARGVFLILPSNVVLSLKWAVEGRPRQVQWSHSKEDACSEKELLKVCPGPWCNESYETCLFWWDRVSSKVLPVAVCFRSVFPCGLPVWSAVWVWYACSQKDSVISINVTLAGHYNVGHCLFLPYLEDKFMCRLFFVCVRYS